ncbi:MAG: T9SS type A sorting domain-containing protein, partial [Bacteroidota bacterium]
PLTTPPTSLPELVQQDPSIQLYPHPANELVHLQSPVGPITAISLFNLAGQLVLTHDFEALSPTVQLDISTLPPGLYPGQVMLKSQQVYPIKLEVK